MSVFDDIVAGYDLGMLPLEILALRPLRRRAFSSLEGDILELGAGTGVNLPLYGPAARVVVVDLSLPMLEVIPQRPTKATIWRVQADVERLPFPQGTFQTVTGSLVFCSVINPSQGFAEIWRVTRKDGRLVLIEHTRGDGLGALLTDLLAPLWLSISEVCHLNRETQEIIAGAGFEVVRLESRVLGIIRLIEAVKNSI